MLPMGANRGAGSLGLPTIFCKLVPECSHSNNGLVDLTTERLKKKGYTVMKEPHILASWGTSILDMV